MPNNIPDYVGGWGIGNFEELLGYPCPHAKLPSSGPYFHMFIEVRKGNTIAGRIKDVLGDAAFDGTITDEKIEFDKKYFPGAMENGAARGIIHYSGLRKKVEHISLRFAGEIVVGIITYENQANMVPRPFLMVA